MAKLPARAPQVMLLAQAALAARDHWQALETEEREVLARLLRKTKGRPSNLSAAEKRELRRLVKRLDILGLGRELIPSARRQARRARR